LPSQFGLTLKAELAIVSASRLAAMSHETCDQQWAILQHKAAMLRLNVISMFLCNTL